MAGLAAVAANMLFELVKVLFCFVLLCSYLLVLLCYFACPVDAVPWYRAVFFTCFAAGF